VVYGAENVRDVDLHGTVVYAAPAAGTGRRGGKTRIGGPGRYLLSVVIYMKIVVI